jgi:hypothetical protein
VDHKKYTEKNANALAEFKFRRIGKLFLWKKPPVMRFRYVRHCTLSEARDYWRKSRRGRTIDQKMVAVHESPCAPTPLILILIHFTYFSQQLASI